MQAAAVGMVCENSDLSSVLAARAAAGALKRFMLLASAVGFFTFSNKTLRSQDESNTIIS
jgi:hypothetical protein